MVSTELLQTLCNFQSPAGEAVSLYFYAGSPNEPSHRNEPALLKEKIRELYGSRKGSSVPNREDLARLLQVVSEMQGNHRLTKIVFACESAGIWHEINLPRPLPTMLSAGNRFLLMPLVSALDKLRRTCIALVDRRNLRLLLLVGDSIREPSLAFTEAKVVADVTRGEDLKKSFYSLTPRGGNDKKQRERQIEAKQHFQFVNGEIVRFMDRHNCDSLLIGCRSVTRSGLEAELGDSANRRLIGYFETDPGSAGAEQVKQRALTLIATHEEQEDQKFVAAARDESGRERLGAVGIPAVCEALERREVWRLLVSPAFAFGQNHAQAAAMCSACGHLKPQAQAQVMGPCEVCHQEMELYPRAQEAILRKALAQQVAVRQVRGEDLPEQIAAILRFRAELQTA